MGVHLVPPGSAIAASVETRSVRDALQWFTREKQWITDMQLQLCRIPSPTFLEHKRAEWMAQQFTGLGCQTRIDRAGNVIAFPLPLSDRPLIAVTAHLDTVLAPRLKEDVYVDSDGKLRGPGVADNGAGLAALLGLARTLGSAGAAPEAAAEGVAEPVLIANVGEEGEGNLSGMRYLCKQSPLASRISAFLVLDGASTERIVVRGLGSRRFDITFTGPGGHSWSDHGLPNPVHALARAVSLFSDTRVSPHPRSSFNVGLIEGGVTINSIPSQARAKVDIRSESNERMDDLVTALLDAVASAQDNENQRASGGRVTARTKEIGSRPAARLPDNAPLLAYVRAADAHLGIRAHLECSSTDANVPLAMGLPALSIGAGGQGGGAHTAQEWFSPECRDLGLKRILLTLSLLMRFGGA